MVEQAVEEQLQRDPAVAVAKPVLVAVFTEAVTEILSAKQARRGPSKEEAESVIAAMEAILEPWLPRKALAKEGSEAALPAGGDIAEGLGWSKACMDLGSAIGDIAGIAAAMGPASGIAERAHRTQCKVQQL
jgi:hypothetical protein